MTINSSSNFNPDDKMVNRLNEQFIGLSYKERLQKFYTLFIPEEVLYTCSFGVHSVFLLDLVHQLETTQQIYFINTGYHFELTIQYKELLQKRYNFHIIEITPEVKLHQLTKKEQWWKISPERCCDINRVSPLDIIKKDYKIWISGLMAFQTGFRKKINMFEKQGSILKFHPLIDLDEAELLYLIGYNKLPIHPMQEKGYGSIGCTHCTKPGEGRSGRWAGSEKSECGLHSTYFENLKK